MGLTNLQTRSQLGCDLNAHDAWKSLTEVREALKGALINRDKEIDSAIMALLCRRHVLFLGPPGTAKTTMFNLIAKAFDFNGDEVFRRLITAFSLPEDLFGPLDFKKFEQGDYVRKTDGFLPHAKFSLKDEIFKGSDPILNAMLTALEEREFDQGPNRVKMPLETVIGCSNEYPQSSILDALYDRFMFREWTDYLQDRGARKELMMMSRNGARPTVNVTISSANRELLQEVTDTVNISEDLIDIMLDIWETLEIKHGIKLSDRRWAQCLAAVKAHAVLEGRTVAVSRDLMVLTRVMWNKHDERPSVFAAVSEHACPGIVKVSKVLDGVTARYVEVDLKQPGVDHLGALLQVIRIGSDELERISANGDISVDDYEYKNAEAKLTSMKNEVGRAIARNTGAYGMK